jgi:hypothetical protein
MPYSSIIQKLPADLQPAIHELVETLRHEWQEQTFARLSEQIGQLAEAQQRTEQRVHELAEGQRALAEAQQRTEQRVHELAEAQQRTEQQVHELAEAQQRTEQRVHELAEAQRRSEERLDRLEETVAELVRAVAELRAAVQGLLEHQRRMQDELAEHTGILLEWRYRDRPYAYFGRVLRRARTVPWEEIEAELEQRLTDEELEEVALLDVLVRGRPKKDIAKDQLWVAVEVSKVVDRHDVERAQRRTEILRRAGYPVVAAVAGREVTGGGHECAQQHAVALIRDGSIEFWDSALEKACGT